MRAVPNKQSIFLMDQMVENFTRLHDLRCAREINFVVHELIINAAEATENAGLTQHIQLSIVMATTEIIVTIIDCAGGIPEDQLAALTSDRDPVENFCERGRGFLFIRQMVDELWFEQLSSSQFLVGIRKIVE